MTSPGTKKVALKIIRIAGWILASFILLFLIIVLLLQFPGVQTYLTGKIVTNISNKTGTTITIDEVAIRFPKTVGLKGIYLEDSSGDTLLHAGGVFVDVGMFGLLKNKVVVNSLELEDVVASMKRIEGDTIFNFQFLIDSLAGSEEVITETPAEEQQADNEASEEGWEVKIEDISLHNIRYLLDDHMSGMILNVSLDEFSTHLGDADLLNGEYLIGNTHLSKPSISIEMRPPTSTLPPDTTSEMPPFAIALEKLVIDDIRFTMTDDAGTSMEILSHEIELSVEKVQLDNYLIEIGDLLADNLQATFQFPPAEDPIEEAEADIDSIAETAPAFNFADIMDWTISIEKFALNESSFKMQSGQPTPSEEFDPQNISLQDINIMIGDIYISPNDIRLDINKINVYLAETFSIRDLRASINLGEETEIELENLQTTNSELAFRFVSRENFLHFYMNELFDFNIDLDITKGIINEDLVWIVPELGDYYFDSPDAETITVDGRITGMPSDIEASEFRVEAPGLVSMQTSGRIKGLPDIDSIFIDIPEFNLTSSPGRFFRYLPDTLIPAGIELPQYLTIESKTRGSLNDFSSNTFIGSNFGNLTLTASINPVQEFELLISTDSFDVGRFLNQSEMIAKPLSFKLEAEGQGLEPQTMQAQVVASIGNLSFNNYLYDDLVFEVSLVDSIIYLDAGYKDDNLAYTIGADYGLYKNTGFLHGDVSLIYAQLDQLGFSENNLMVKTDIHTHLDFDVKDFFNGEIFITNSSLAADGEVYDFPEINLRSDSRPEDYNLTMRSQLVNLDFSGNFSPTGIPGELTKHLSYYYDPALRTAEMQVDTLNSEGKSFNLTLVVYPDDLISDLVLNDLNNYDTLDLTVSYYNLMRELKMKASWGGIDYGNILLSQFNADISSNREALDFYVQFDELSISDINIHEFNTSGYFLDNELNFDVGLRDKTSEPLYAFSGDLSIGDSLSVLHISPHHLLINGEEWSVPDSNRIAYADKYLSIKDFNLVSNDRQISLSTRIGENATHFLDMMLENIDLGQLTDFAGEGSPTISGVLDGDVTVVNLFQQPAFVANLSVNNFGFRGDTIGKVDINASNPGPDLYDLSAAVQSNLTDLRIEGTYQTGENTGVNMDVNLARLDLPSLEGLLAGSLTDMQGYLSGNIGITGTISEPLLNGQITFNNTAFHVPAINSGYEIDNERIVFDGQDIRFPNIRIKDQEGHEANLNGSMNISDFEQIAFSIGMNSRNFLLMDVAEDQNDSYHGRILMDSDLRITGTTSEPTIEGRIKLNEGSAFTFLLPQSNPEAIGDEGVVEFMEIGDTLFHRIASQREGEEALTSSFSQLDVSINLEVDQNTDVRIIIDQYAGDFIAVQGGGELSFGMDPGGRISLSGRYEMVEGEYLLTFYDVIRRNFTIQPGSNIVWAGDPMEAQVDITAVYSIRTNARDLLVTHMTGDQTQNPALRQQFPFEVLLKMRGELMEPQISFELQLPQEYTNAFDGALAARLNQINQNESELNKQVFALLIMGNFIQDNPFASSGGGGGFASTARSSASQILTQQLNRLSDRFIKGVDINFEVESSVDYTSEQGGGSTELQMEVSRNFFDERVRVSVGGNIELEDETRRQTNPGDIAGDFKIEYLLIPSGELKVMGFRTRNWADIFDGQIYETGVALIFEKSYNKFKDLFRQKEADSIYEETDSYDY